MKLMRILTLNTWHNNGPWRQRRDALVHDVIQYAPDILLFQELFDADWSKELQARLGYPYLVSTDCMHSGLVILSKLPPQANEIYRMNTKSPFETLLALRALGRAQWCWRSARYFQHPSFLGA